MLKPTSIAAMLLFVTILVSETSMAWLNKKYLFSEVQGVVLLNGSPVADAQVERIYHWGWEDKEFKEQTSTDQDGNFSFSEATGSSLFGSFLPHQPLIHQNIFVHHAGQTYEAWKHTKYNYTQNGELDGRPINIMCELTTKPSLNEKLKVYGICQLH